MKRSGLCAALPCCSVSRRLRVAQEGHPLKGSWLGTWTGNKVHGNDVLLVLTWDGKNITGTINPGTDNIPIKNATLNPEGWLVHIEADAKDKAGPAADVHDRRQDRKPSARQSQSSPARGRTATADTGAFRIGRQ